MQNDREFGRPVRRLEDLMRRRLGLSRGPLAKRVARAGRDLPRAVRDDLLSVAEADRMARNPRLAPRIDRALVRAAYRRAVSYLCAPEIDARRQSRMLERLGVVVANLLVVMVLLAMTLWWQDLI